MSKIQETAVLAAEGGAVSIKDTKVSEVLTLELVADVEIAGATFAMSDLVTFLKTIVMSSKLTRGSTNLAVNVNLFELIKHSTNYKGLCRGQIDANGSNLNLTVPIIQSNGLLSGLEYDWQADVVNNNVNPVSVTSYGFSFKNGNAFFKYSVNTLENQLEGEIVPNFTKINIQTNFNQVDVVIGGQMQKIEPSDAKNIMNLDDEIVIALDVRNADNVYDKQMLLLPSDTGSVTIYNTEIPVAKMVLYRLNNAAPAINYSTSTLITV